MRRERKQRYANYQVGEVAVPGKEIDEGEGIKQANPGHGHRAAAPLERACKIGKVFRRVRTG